MTVQTAASAAYIVAALLFILALAGLSRHETARFGNTFGIAGMAIALVATLVLALSSGFTALQSGLLIAAVVAGAAIGLFRAARVPMTGMPELIALFHSFVGPRRGAGGLERLPARSRRRAVSVSRPTCWGSTTPRWSSGCSSGP
ncbi:MAG: NAD(P)(+) transhydrogenase (Re/Si-specific) subunit beta [Pseudonocardia sp.]